MIKDDVIKQSKWIFDVSYISDKGGRPVNEDSVAVEHNDKMTLISVADGLGAHGGGDIASEMAERVLKKEIFCDKKFNFKRIDDVFESINEEVIQKQTDEIKMKTTLACMILTNKHMYAAHLGDTRMYIFENNKFIHTADHSVAYDEEMKKGGTLDDVRKNPNKHILKAALGVSRIRPPDVLKRRIKENTSILICSDGFWEYVNEDEMVETSTKSSNVHQWLEAMLKCHYKKVENFNDNYSAICLKIIKNRGGEE